MKSETQNQKHKRTKIVPKEPKTVYGISVYGHNMTFIAINFSIINRLELQN